jgi:hypothetical protein
MIFLMNIYLSYHLKIPSTRKYYSIYALNNLDLTSLTMIDDVFVIRPLSISSSYMFYIDRGVDSILCCSHETNERVCNDYYSATYGGHISGMVTSQKIICASYFWPSLFTDCIKVVNLCANFQLYTPKARNHPIPLHLIITTSPFCKWGINFMECKSIYVSGHKYIIVVIDYFTKWVESMSMFNNRVAIAPHFFFNHIITHFDVPKQLVSYHGSHFKDEAWRHLASHWILSTNICLLTICNEMAKLRLSIKYLKPCYSRWLKSKKSIGIINSSLLCGPIEHWLRQPLFLLLFTVYMESREFYLMSISLLTCGTKSYLVKLMWPTSGLLQDM